MLNLYLVNVRLISAEILCYKTLPGHTSLRKLQTPTYISPNQSTLKTSWVISRDMVSLLLVNHWNHKKKTKKKTFAKQVEDIATLSLNLMWLVWLVSWGCTLTNKLEQQLGTAQPKLVPEFYWNTIENSLKHPLNFLETPLKLSVNTLKFPWNILETSFKLQIPFKQPWNTTETL